MAGQPFYDMTGDVWSHEPQYSQDNGAAAPYFGHPGESLHMDTNFAWMTSYYGFGGQDESLPLQMSPLELQQTHEYAVVSPSSLKRPPTATDLLQTGSDGLTRNNSKRSKQERFERRDDGFFQCTYPGCSHRSSLMCEIRKHFTKHRPEEARPHGCPICAKRFNWPKDVRRHVRQKHKDVAEGAQAVPVVVQPPDLTTDESVESDENALTPSLSAQPEQEPTIVHPISHHGGGRLPGDPAALPQVPKRKKKFSLSSVGGLIMALQSLSIGSTKDTDYEEDGNRHILITTDYKIWHKVSLDNVRSSESLVQKIKDVYQKHEGQHTSSFLLYRHHPDKADKRIPEGHILSAARKAAAARHTLEVVLSPILPSTH